MAATDAARAQTGFYCSTSGTYFADLQSLSEHYKSDFHRYNLKRKVAGLPPVTKEWFEARKAQLSSAAAGASAAAPVQRIWIDPLTKKKFNTENTYQAFVRSKKYAELVRKSGQPAPEPTIVTRQQAADGAQQQDGAAPSGDAAPGPARAAPAGFKLVAPSGGLPLRQRDGADMAMADADGSGDEGDDDDDESGWETASDDEAAELAGRAAAEAAEARRGGDASMRDADAGADGAADADGADWDVCRSLFDNHVSASFQANLEYMYKRFGFYLPDAQYLRDPEGLLKYLGAKLAVGGVPLYVRGDDARSRQFRSLHAVQRHMVDTCQCKMAYDDNEEEYEEFYDYSMGEDGEEGEDESGAVVLAGAVPGLSSSAVAGYELVVGGGDGGGGGGGKVLGHRDFARLYRQRHRPEDERHSVVVNTMLARYRALGAPTSTDSVRDRNTKAEATSSRRAQQASQLKMSMIKNTLKKLPKNCEY